MDESHLPYVSTQWMLGRKHIFFRYSTGQLLCVQIGCWLGCCCWGGVLLCCCFLGERFLHHPLIFPVFMLLLYVNGQGQCCMWHFASQLNSMKPQKVHGTALSLAALPLVNLGYMCLWHWNIITCFKNWHAEQFHWQRWQSISVTAASSCFDIYMRFCFQSHQFIKWLGYLYSPAQLEVFCFSLSLL